MKKAHIISFFLVLSVVWSQKEIPGLGSTLETTGNERLNGEKVQPIDAKVVQQVRMMKANKEIAFMKKQIISGQKVDKKTFKVPQQESKFLVIKEIIDQKKKLINDNVEIRDNNKELNEINYQNIEVKLTGSNK